MFLDRASLRITLRTASAGMAEVTAAAKHLQFPQDRVITVIRCTLKKFHYTVFNETTTEHGLPDMDFNMLLLVTL